MTPLHIELLLHAYCSPEPHQHRNARAAKVAAGDLVQADLIQPKVPSEGCSETTYITTDHGDLVVSSLCESLAAGMIGGGTP